MPSVLPPPFPAKRLLWGTLTIVVLTAMGTAGCGGSEQNANEPTGPTLAASASVIQSASAAAMGEVSSVRFELSVSGAPIYIDRFESISLDGLIGEFSVPRSAQAALDVEVDGSLKTQLAAVAIDDEVWLSNPITGRFETLPEGYDIDPSRFFDPQDGWRPLMAGLTDVELVGRERREGDNGGERYHLVGTATADQMREITAGLIGNQDVRIDFWIQPVTGLVRSAEFTTETSGQTVDWTLELSAYGDEFTIVVPDDVATAVGDPEAEG